MDGRTDGRTDDDHKYLVVPLPAWDEGIQGRHIAQIAQCIVGCIRKLSRVSCLHYINIVTMVDSN